MPTERQKEWAYHYPIIISELWRTNATKWNTCQNWYIHANQYLQFIAELEVLHVYDEILVFKWYVTKFKTIYY
jgi:hypothetical protein